MDFLSAARGRLLHAQDDRPVGQDQTPRVFLPPKVKLFDKIRFPYIPRDVSTVDFRNSNRVDQLIRAGQLYLSLQDAIDLAIENNLDLQLQRFNPRFADTDLLRAKGGGLLRGIDFNIRNLPQGIGRTRQPLADYRRRNESHYHRRLQLGGSRALAGDHDSESPGERTVRLLRGPATPAVRSVSQRSAIHGVETNTFENNFNTAGVDPLIANNFLGTFGYSQGFSSGAAVNASFNETRTSFNSVTSNYDPFTTGNLSVSVVQPLLQGFGIEMNRRFIRMAENTQDLR